MCVAMVFINAQILRPLFLCVAAEFNSRHILTLLLLQSFTTETVGQFALPLSLHPRLTSDQAIGNCTCVDYMKMVIKQ